MRASQFIDHTSLKWSHDIVAGQCPGETQDLIRAMETVDAGVLGAGGYSHRAICNHSGALVQSNDNNIAPYEFASGYGNSEGMYMNLLNEWRTGGVYDGTEPTFARYVPGDRIVYWFHYGYSNLYNFPEGEHEGEWERVAIQLSANDTPLKVEYFIHTESCILPWADAPRSGNHVLVASAREAHASYPLGGDRLNAVDVVPNASNSNIWNAYNYVDGLVGKPWYDYGGGWGDVGNGIPGHAGPEGPSQQAKPKFGIGTPRCPGL